MSLFHSHVAKYASYYKAAGDPPVEFRSTPKGQLLSNLVRQFGLHLPKLIPFNDSEANADSLRPATTAPASNSKGFLRIPGPPVPREISPPVSYVGPNLPATSRLIT